MIQPDFQFSVDDLHVSVYSCHQPERPVVYLHDLDACGPELLSFLKAQDAPACSLVSITVPKTKWNDIMAPWRTPGHYPAFLRCSGGAPAYLKTLIETILPQAEAAIGSVGWRAVAGYSLAGLFALYALCESSEIFSRACLVSGSFWYPDLKDWFFDHLPAVLPQSIYFSTSLAEFHSKNRFFAPLKDTVQMIEGWFEQQGIPAVLVVNPGNHFQQPLERTADGLLWILDHPEQTDGGEGK